MAINKNIITTGDSSLPFISSKKDVTSLVNPDILKSIKSTPNLPISFGEQLSSKKEKILLTFAADKLELANLYDERIALIQEEIKLDLEYKNISPSSVIPKYNVEIIANYMIITPTTIIDNSIAVLFGGCCWASLERMKSYIPDSILSKKRVIIVDETVNKKYITYEQALEFTNKKFPNERISSISGFSKGGRQAWKATTSSEIGKYSYVNLMDPEMYNDEVKLARESSKILMIYNPSVWTCCPTVTTAQSEAGPKMGNSAIKVNMSHANIPTYFFENYSNRF